MSTGYSRRSREEQIVTWIGVIAQLVRTRNNQILVESDLSYPQFVMLLHFCHEPEREWTVTALAAAFQTNQPGVTKTVQKLLRSGYLEARVDENDSRMKHLRVTRRGLRARNEAISMLAPDLSQFFKSWKPSEIAELHRLLERLKNQLDESRDSVRVPSATPSSRARGRSRSPTRRRRPALRNR
jgi:DNA-binding MarR family transcriptional regulator